MPNSLSSRFVALGGEDDDEIVVEPDRVVKLCLPPLYRFGPFVVFLIFRRPAFLSHRVACCFLRPPSLFLLTTNYYDGGGAAAVGVLGPSADLLRRDKNKQLNNNVVVS